MQTCGLLVLFALPVFSWGEPRCAELLALDCTDAWILQRCPAVQCQVDRRVPSLLEAYSHIFVPHIAKTGGGAMHDALKNFSDRTGHAHELCYEAESCDALNASARFVSGHGVFYNYHQGLKGGWNKSSVLYLTTFRDPIQRIASYYWFRKRNGGDQMTMQQYVNGMLNVDCLDVWMFVTQIMEIHANGGCAVELDQPLLAKAEAIVQRDFFVLNLDRWDESLSLLSLALASSVALPNVLDHRNPSPTCIPPHIHDQMTVKLRLELALHAIGMRKYGDQLSQFSAPTIDEFAPKRYPRCAQVEVRVDDWPTEAVTLDSAPLAISGTVKQAYEGLHICAFLKDIGGEWHRMTCFEPTRADAEERFEFQVHARPGRHELTVDLYWARSADHLAQTKPVPLFGRFVQPLDGKLQLSLRTTLTSADAAAWRFRADVELSKPDAAARVCLLIAGHESSPICETASKWPLHIGPDALTKINPALPGLKLPSGGFTVAAVVAGSNGNVLVQSAPDRVAIS